MSEVRQLTENQELVEGIYTETAYQFQTDSQSHAAQVVHRFIEAQAACIAERTECPPQLVFHNITRIAQQYPPRFFFALYYMSYDAYAVIESLAFCTTYARLVGNLEEISHHFAAFAVHPAVGQAHLLEPRQDLADLLGQHQSGKVDEDRRSQSGPDVGRACGEVAELLVKGVRHPVPQLGVQALDYAKGVGDVETGMERLETEVIFLVHHDADAA